MIPRALVFGEIVFDRFADGSEVLGGAPFNVAWNLHGLGVSPLLVSRVGDDALGRKARTAMESWGMDTSGVQVDSHHATGVVDVRLDEGGESSFDIVAERAYDFIEPDELPTGIGECDLLVHGTLALRSARSGETFERLTRTMQAPSFCDVNLRAPWWDRERVLDVLARAKIVKLNEPELEQLAPEPADEAMRIREILSHGPRTVLLTRGARGAAVFSEDGRLARTAPTDTPRVVDTVGAGDGFASVFILGLLRGWGVEETMARAQRFAVAVVGLRGATVADESFYRGFDWS